MVLVAEVKGNGSKKFHTLITHIKISVEKSFVLCILLVESMYLKGILRSNLSNHNLVLRNHGH